MKLRRFSFSRDPATSRSIATQNKSATKSSAPDDVKVYGIEELYRPAHTEPHLEQVNLSNFHQRNVMVFPTDIARQSVLLPFTASTEMPTEHGLPRGGKCRG